MTDKPREHEHQLHEPLVKGDVVASAEIAEQYLPLVLERLHFRFRHLDDKDCIDSVVHEAFLNYFLHPEPYDPDRSGLTTYLLMSAVGDLRNLLRQGEKRLPNCWWIRATWNSIYE